MNTIAVCLRNKEEGVLILSSSIREYSTHEVTIDFSLEEQIRLLKKKK